MPWGVGPKLGFLAILGYLVFAAGMATVWHSRGEFLVWIRDEVGAIRRNFVRHAVIGGFPGLRDETRLKLVPSGFARTLGRMPRRRMNRSAILLVVGSLLVLLDFIV